MELLLHSLVMAFVLFLSYKVDLMVLLFVATEVVRRQWQRHQEEIPRAHGGADGKDRPRCQVLDRQ